MKAPVQQRRRRKYQFAGQLTLRPARQAVAARLLPVVASRLTHVPYAVVGHSVGTWAAFELLSRLRDEGLPMPVKTFFSCFPAPDIPAADRPWKARDAGDRRFEHDGPNNFR